MTVAFIRGLLRRVVLMGSLGSIGLVLLVAILAVSAQVAIYGFPVQLLFSLALVLATTLVFRYTIRKRNGTVTRWECSWWIAGLAVAAVFLLTNQLIVRGIAVGIWDAEGEMFPFQAVVADFARSGRFLHWDPWSDAGLPLASDPQVGAFSPLNIVIGLLTGGTSLGFRIYWLLVWALGGLGILMLAKQLKAPAWGGAVVAIGFLFCGVYTGNAEHTPCIVAFSFVPLIIWRLDRALVSRSLRPAAEAGALWGLSALSGYPAQTIMTGFFCVFWAVGRLAFPESNNDTRPSADGNISATIRTRFKLLVAAVALVLVIGLAVLSPTYYAFFSEGAGTTARSGPLSREVAIASNALHPGAISTLASPYLAALKADNQIIGDGKMWPGIDLSMCSIYSGGIVVVFALLSILARTRDRWRWWLVVIAGLSLACAVGGALPLRGWIYDWIYPTRFFRHPALFGLYFVFTISALALVGTRELQAALGNAEAPVWRRFKIASLVCAATALAAFVAVTGLHGAERSISVRQAPTIWLIVSGVWLAVLGVAMLSGFRSDAVRLRYLPAILLAIAAGDAILTGGVAQGFEQFALNTSTMVSTNPKDVGRWQSLDRRHSSVIDLTANGLMREESPCVSNSVEGVGPGRNPHASAPCNLSDQLITKVPVLESYSTLRNPFLLRTASHPVLKEAAIGSERIWFSREALQVPATEEFFTALEQRAETLGAPPLVIHSLKDLTGITSHTDKSSGRTDDLARIARLPACDRITVRVEKYDPEELVIICNSPADGWVLVTDRWGPSWRGEVNGEPVEIYAGNFIFRAVQVRAGENNIRFTYHPPLFPWLLILSWGSLAATALWSISSAARRV